MSVACRQGFSSWLPAWLCLPSVWHQQREKHSLGKGSLPVNANKTLFKPFLCALLKSVNQTVNKRPSFQQILPVLFPWKLALSGETWQMWVWQPRPSLPNHQCSLCQRCFSCYDREMFACAPVIPAHTWLLSKSLPFGLNENQQPLCLNPDRFLLLSFYT